jgi:hypothetical protein
VYAEFGRLKVKSDGILRVEREGGVKVERTFAIVRLAHTHTHPVHSEALTKVVLVGRGVCFWCGQQWSRDLSGLNMSDKAHDKTDSASEGESE